VDAALASMSGTTSQPCLNSIAAALRHTPRDTGLDQDALDALSRYWADVREAYYPFEESPKSPSAEVYRHEMPGGQYTNLLQQARSLGLGGRWDEVVNAYSSANRLLGDIVKVTPSSKVVGDLALFMVTNDLTPEAILEGSRRSGFPTSVVEMLQGQLGYPEGGWPRALRDIVLRSAGAEPIEGRAGEHLPAADFPEARARLAAEIQRDPTDEELLSFLLYPKVFLEYDAHLRRFERTTVVPTPEFFYGLQAGQETSVEIERGKRLIIKFLTIGEVHENGTRTVFFELNGQPRHITVADRAASAGIRRHPEGDPDNPSHIAAPMPGKVSSVAVQDGQTVRAGERLLSIEAMKMETAVYSPRDARIASVLVQAGETVPARALLVVLDEGTPAQSA
jgi:pyruvate carboxylase